MELHTTLNNKCLKCISIMCKRQSLSLSFSLQCLLAFMDWAIHCGLDLWLVTKGFTTSILRLYKRMKPLSFTFVFYGLTRLCWAQIWTLKTKLPSRRLFLIMHKFRSTYPISIWPTTSWIFSRYKKVLPSTTILCQLQPTGFKSASRVSTPEVLYPSWFKQLLLKSFQSKGSIYIILLLVPY